MGNQNTIRVLLVDDSAAILSAWSRLVDRTSGLELVGALLTSEEVERAIAERAPHVVVVDWSVLTDQAVADGVAAAAARSGARMVVYSGRSDPSTVAAAEASGASGFVGKHEEPRHVIEVIRRVCAGERVFPGDA